MTKPMCECECGETTGGGRFRPGHDAKLKSRLIHEALDGHDAKTRKAAEQRLARLGWTKFLDRKRELVTLTPTELRQLDDQRKEEKAKANIELLAKYKQAAAILKTQGRYHRMLDDGTPNPDYTEITRLNVDLIIDNQ